MNEKLSTRELIEMLASRHGISIQDAEAFVKEFFLLVEEALLKDKLVKIKGLGTFKLLEVENRESVDVNTKVHFQVKGHNKIAFVPDSAVKEMINKPFSHFEAVTLKDSVQLDDISMVTEGKDGEMPDEKNIVSQEVQNTQDGETEERVENNVSSVEQQPILHSLSQNEKTEESSTEKTAVITTKKEKNPSSDDVDVAAHENKSSITYLIAAIFLVVVLCGGTLLYFYYPNIFSFLKEKENVDTFEYPEPELESIESVDSVSMNDSVGVISVADKEKAQPMTNEATGTSQELSESKKTVYSEDVDYEIIGTKERHIIKAGETLTKLAIRYYGNKAMWPYIVKYNKDIIKDPDNVPHGTTLKIPALAEKKK